VEFIVSANISAESTIQGQGGYLRTTGNVLFGAECETALGSFTGGTAGLIFNQTTALSVDAVSGFSGGRIYAINQQIAAEFNLLGLAGNPIRATVDLSSDFNTTFTGKHFLGGRLSATVDTNLITQPGKRYNPVITLFSEADIPVIRVKIVSIDEYYIDKVEKETRLIKTWDELRTSLVTLEATTTFAFNEDRISDIEGETRTLRPELGRPIATDRRIRRITA
jgi:hypothetical protein